MAPNSVSRKRAHKMGDVGYVIGYYVLAIAIKPGFGNFADYSVLSLRGCTHKFYSAQGIVSFFASHSQ